MARPHARTVGVGETGGAGLRASAASPSTAAAPRRPPPIHLSSSGAARPPTAPAHTPLRATSRTIRSTGWSSRRWTCSRRTTAQRSWRRARTHTHYMCEHVRCRRLQEVDCSHALCRCARGEPKVTSLTRSLSLSRPLTLCRRARRGTRSSSRRPSTRSARTSTLTRRGRRLSTRLRKKSSPACSTAARYYTRARARSPCSQPVLAARPPIHRGRGPAACSWRAAVPGRSALRGRVYAGERGGGAQVP